LTLATGCATGRHQLYAGVAQPLGQIARVRSGNNWDGSVRLLAVNGQRGPNGAGFGYSSRWDGTFRVDLLPGEYTLTVRHVWAAAETNLCLTASAGHTYLVYAAFKDGAGQYLIYDKTENKQLAADGQYPFALVSWAPGYYGPYPGGPLLIAPPPHPGPAFGPGPIHSPPFRPR